MLLVQDQLKRSKKELDEKNNLINIFIEASSDFISIIDINGKRIFINSSALHFLGYDHGEVIDQPFANIIYEEDKIATSNVLKELPLLKIQKNFENRIILNDGSIANMSWTFTWEEENQYIYSIGRDITNLKKAENEIVEMEGKFRNIFEKSADAILIIENGIFLECNQATIDMLGYKSKKEFLNVPPSVLSPETQPDGRNSNEKAAEMMHLALVNGTHRFEWMHVKSSKELFPVEVLLTAISNDVGNNVIHCVWRDITDRKIAEAALAESEKRFRTIFEDAPLGIAIIDFLTGVIIDANPMFGMISGRPLVELINNTWMSITHPEDLEFDFGKKELLLNGTISDFQMEKRYIHPDGSHIWVKMTISHLIKEENGPLVHLCMIEDITQRKEDDEKLKLLSLAVEQSPVSILITEPSGNIEYANKKFMEIAGYTLEEVLGKNPRFLKSGFTSAEEYKTLWQTIDNGKVWEGIFQNRKKDGELYWEAASISPIINERGIATHILAIKEDITDRKKMNDKLLKIVSHQSHQVRGPLTTIMGINAAMNLPITLEEKLELLKHIDTAAKKLDAAIHEIVKESE